MIRDKRFYKSFAGLTASIALQNLLTYSVNLADNIMIGRYSQNALSGVSLCNQYQFFLQMLVVGVSEGIVVLGARYWGKKELKPIPSIIGCGLRFGCGLALLMFLAALLAPRQLIGLMTNDATVAAQALDYLQVICFTYVIFAGTNMLASSLRSIGIVKIGYMIAGSTLCINIVLNSLLIYGRWGFPELGARGAAIATLISRTVELLIVIWFLKYKEHALNLNLKNLVCIDTRYMRDYVQVSLPLLITQALWGFNSIAQTAIIGNMDDACICAAGKFDFCDCIPNHLGCWLWRGECRGNFDRQDAGRKRETAETGDSAAAAHLADSVCGDWHFDRYRPVFGAVPDSAYL